MDAFLKAIEDHTFAFMLLWMCASITLFGVSSLFRRPEPRPRSIIGKEDTK